MNTDNFEQVPMNKDRVGDMTLYLKENESCQVLTYGEEAISVELPAAVVLEVVETEPGIKGDTAQGATKPAKMETGLVVTVPLFINTGDKLKVDTRAALTWSARASHQPRQSDSARRRYRRRDGGRVRQPGAGLCRRAGAGIRVCRVRAAALDGARGKRAERQTLS
jgi:hypothetical protein